MNTKHQFPVMRILACETKQATKLAKTPEVEPMKKANADYVERNEVSQ